MGERGWGIGWSTGFSRSFVFRRPAKAGTPTNPRPLSPEGRGREGREELVHEMLHDGSLALAAGTNEGNHAGGASGEGRLQEAQLGGAAEEAKWLTGAMVDARRPQGLALRLGGAFRTQRTHHGPGLPHLAVRDLLQLLLQLLPIIGPAVGLQHAPGFLAGRHAAGTAPRTPAWLASRKRMNQSSAPRWAVVEQLAYIQSMPFSAISGYRLCVASSTVSLNASDGEWPWSRSTSYWASHRP